MKKVGEVSHARMAQSAKIGSMRRVGIRDIPVECECGFKTHLSEAGIHSHYSGISKKSKSIDNWKCQYCREKDRKEMDQLLINLAKRKGLM